MKAGTLEIEMITNIARLQKEMADMKRAVGGAMGDIAATAGRADRAIEAVGTRGMTRMGGSAKLAGHQMQNLVYQLNDVVVSLASGQKPMTVFMQQGSQIGQIAMQAGVGIGGMARAVLGLAASAAAAALTNPYLLAAAAAAGIAFGAFKMFQSSVKQSGELDRYAQSLGLTAKEMEKLGPVGITAGDVMRGLWRTISDGLNLGPVFSSLKEWAVWAFQKVLEVGKISIAVIYAGWIGGFGAIRAVWQALPGVIGEAAVGAANLAISGIEYLANKAIAALNWLASWVNPVLDRVGLATISQIETVALPRMENSFAGSTARMGATVRDEFTSAFGDAMGMMDAFSAQWRENTLQAARDGSLPTLPGFGLIVRTGRAAPELAATAAKKAKPSAPCRLRMSSLPISRWKPRRSERPRSRSSGWKSPWRRSRLRPMPHALPFWKPAKPGNRPPAHSPPRSSCARRWLRSNCRSRCSASRRAHRRLPISRPSGSRSCSNAGSRPGNAIAPRAAS
ncbi:phage tail length tape measure family protein [Novosphingobium sp. ST904]|uniref:phage tail length tape measure family protein n=1 Tax=Novosphingobium sp. ST904 TaxID=1684385 RepID=UPI0006C8CAA0|nr:phage tail length tape measure family protein [Novosphingobium sp. ST904]KPH62994.1 hypothetical protein ADT71_13785 [Novosphingobium sp. ST904]